LRVQSGMLAKRQFRNTLKVKGRLTSTNLKVTGFTPNSINFQGRSINIIPEDFHVILDSYENEELKFLFAKIKTVLSLVHIADLSKINEDNVELKINGYRNSTFKVFFSEIQHKGANKSENNYEYIYKIYRWVYSDGNKIDKAILARNIISLHCRYHNILEIGQETFDSIKTNYSFYLKQNTEDYLEKKRELHLSIINKCSELADIISEFSGDLKRNFVAYFTFLATLLISNSFMGGRFYDIFTPEVTLISSIVIIGSVFYFLISLRVSTAKEKSIDDFVEDLKISYEYIFDKNEISKIIESSIVYKNSKKNYKKNKWIVIVLWIVFTIILFIALDFVSGDSKLLWFFNIF